MSTLNRETGFATRRVRLPRFAVAAAFVASFQGSVSATDGLRTSPANASLSTQKLERITDYFNRQVGDGKIPGAVVLIQRGGKPVYLHSFGTVDPRSGEPMTQDAIFRLYSMTKPITSVAAMILVNGGKLGLDDPLSKYIPSFSTMFVGIESQSEEGDAVLTLERAVRPITIKDLLRQSAGIPYGFYGEGLVRKAYGNADFLSPELDNALLAEKIALLPLHEQPGTVWDYGYATDVLGRVIEVVSGQSLYEFEKEHLLDPLGMTDTAFHVANPDKRRLIAEPLLSERTLTVERERSPRELTKWESGGGGMVSTIHDFGRFCQMLLNGGKLDGRRYLKQATLAAMTTNQIEPDGPLKRGDYYFPGDGFGFGLGFAIRVGPGEYRAPGALGELMWDGAGGTYFWIDPTHDMFVVLMMQSTSERGRIQPEFKALVYDAFEK
ncbi:MAG: serine hydrolase domain-containing protein [Afipia sp.]